MDTTETKNDLEKCGIIMPISELDGCGEQHWREVKNILSDAIKEAGFEAELVSDADDVGIIQKRIIQNIYENPIVVCDVSGKNPNVMFELGMRLAFDKPTIIVKDDKTNYSFDTSPIEHLTYPRDLRYLRIVEFKEKLTLKVKGTYEKSHSDPNYTTFLKNFGEFTSPKLETKEVSKEDFIIEELKQLKREISINGRRQIELLDRNEKFAYRDRDLINKDISMELNHIIEKELHNYKVTCENFDINELRKSIHASNEIRDLGMKLGVSYNWLYRNADKILDIYYNNIINKDSVG